MRYKIWLLLGLPFAGVIIVCVALASYAAALPPLPPPDTIVIYDGGKIASERTIAADSSEAKALTDWVAQHSSGWSSSLATYAPVHVAKGDGFQLNFQHGRCILNYLDPKDGKWRQIVRRLGADEAEPAVFGK